MYLSDHIRYKICLCLIIFFCSYKTASAKKDQRDVFADSVMAQVFNRSEVYGRYIAEYNALAYVKGTSFVKKKNILLRFAPDFFELDRKNSYMIFESIVDVHYIAPNHFMQRIIAMNGTKLQSDEISRRAMQFLNINVYNPTSFNDEILMPTVQKALNYYRFFYESSSDTMNHQILKIRIEPTIKSRKLVSGYIYIVDKLWTVAKFDLKGKWEFSEFQIQTNFGLPDKDFLMPTGTELYLRMKVIENEVVNHYSSRYTYISSKKYKNKEIELSRNYDLSDYFNVHLDTLPVVKDSLFWSINRPIPLTNEEQEIYAKCEKKILSTEDSLALYKKKSWSFTKGIISPRRFEYNSTQFRYSGLLNPFKFAYSKRDGIIYWQQLKLNKKFDSGQQINFRPDIGFVFKRKDFFFNTPLNYLFNPSKMGQIELSVGNRNQSYNSRIIDLIENSVPDSINFDNFNLEYYRHYYLTLTGQYELFNGFMAYMGVDYHHYQPVKSEVTQTPLLEESLNDGVTTLIDDKYKSFVPTVGFRWTPGQYYRINERRKEYLWSHFPTFSVEYAHGMNNVLGSNSYYERLEADIQQRIPLGLFRSIQYYAGVGAFTNTQSIYFADFRKFARKNFPQSWNDHIGGVFHLLDSRWYNASNSYMQFHVMYESPFVLLQLFRHISWDIVKERFYLSQLYTPALPFYTEFGYGIGNHIFNIGVFASLNKGKYESSGFKFAFEF